MKNTNLKSNFINGTKWSIITEIIAKLVTPITNMILARILAPEAFGVISTVTMIISFADMFTDAGFQKYLVQHEFEDEDEKFKFANVAFWTNILVSVIIWAIIILFRNEIAVMVGNPGLGNVAAVACIQLIFTSFSSIQMALYRRNFDFKTLFLVRIISIFIPVVVTIPLAILGFNYWALIIGTICGQLSNAIIMTVKSSWKPTLFYDIKILKKMLSFSIWSLIEAISIWLTSWIDVFIIGNALNQYYLGIYKSSTNLVNSLMAIITSSIIPVLFSMLSRLQNDEEKFNATFLKIQRLVSIFVFPLGIGVFVYSDLATKIMLGDKWNEASGVIGIWALTSSIMIVLGNFNSEVYRSKGRPKLSFLSQVLHLIVLVPVCIISSKYGFWVLVNSRALIRFQGILVGIIIMKFAIGFPVKKIFRGILPTASVSIIMGILGFILKRFNNGVIWNIISILICGIFYFVMLYFFTSVRKDLNIIINYIKSYLNNKTMKNLNDI